RRTGVNAPFARPRPRRTQTGALVTSTPSFHVHRTHRSDANGGDTHPRRHADQTWMVVIGREESAGMSSVEGVVPAATKSEPRAATMAPLSVHSPGRGTRRRTPAASHRS